MYMFLGVKYSIVLPNTLYLEIGDNAIFQTFLIMNSVDNVLFADDHC